MPLLSPPATHTLQLFDDAKSRTDALVGFVRQGLSAGDRVLVVATREHWQPVTARLLRRGLQLDADIASYRLTALYAVEMLEQFTIRHKLDRGLFNRTVGDRVRRLRRVGPRLRIYGEMVDVLAGRGDFPGAIRLEQWWNELLCDQAADLLCGYSSNHFGDPQRADALSEICQTHSRLRVSPHDRLGSYLVDGQGVGVSG